MAGKPDQSDGRAPQGPPGPPKPGHEWSWARFSRNAVIIAGAIALTVWFIVEGVVPNVVPKNFGVVEEGAIYRSGVLTTAAFEDVVEDNDVRTVVDLRHEARNTQREKAAAEALGLRYVQLPLFGDGRGDPNMYVQALRIMNDPEAQPVLVHCSAGAERTGGAVALYRHIFEGVPLDEAYAECAEHRHDPARNPNLKPMLDAWVDEIERAVRTGGTIDYTPGDGPARIDPTAGGSP